MRVLLALALLVWAATDAHHSPEHNLRGPAFLTGKTQRYELTLNMTSGIPGLTSQISKAVIRATVNVRPKTEIDYLVKIENVKISEPRPSISSDEEYVTLKRDTGLESDLSKPYKFVLRDGEVESYYLGESEREESKQIKRSIIKHLAFKLQDQSDERYENTYSNYPYVYNVTKETTYGPVTSWYTVSVSPYADFPYEQNVFNVTKTEGYEQISYPSRHYHHNFAKQGCPEVCKYHNDNETNKYGAGCPHGYEPHHTPLKLYTTSQYNLRLTEGRMVLENALIMEKHVASMYDQDMVITISAEYWLKDITDKRIEEIRDSKRYTSLEEEDEDETEPENRMRSELGDEFSYVAKVLPQLAGSDVHREVEEQLDRITEVVVKADIERRESQEVGEKIIILQRLISLLKKSHLQKLWNKIVDIQSYRPASETEKVKRQLVLEVLPLAGTEEAVEFIKYLIENKKVAIWEAKELLEALPENLMRPKERSIKNIYDVLEMPHVKRNYLLHSAAHFTLARIIEKACVSAAFRNSSCDAKDEEILRERQYSTYPEFSGSNYQDDDDDDDFYSGLQNFHTLRTPPTSSSSASRRQYECPKEFVEKFIRETAEKLRSVTEMKMKVTYIETLAHIGSRKVLPILMPYIYGTAKDIDSYTPADVDFLKTVTLYSVHNIISHYPTEVLKYVTPIYFNHTEAPRVRIAAFSVIIRSHPPLHLLEHIALDSWRETSNEVGSFVYSTVSTFGNSSEPCMLLTSQRIKHVISQFKKYEIGHQHSRSLLRTFFDELRNFAINYRASHGPSNETFIPNTLYASLTYNIDSLKDIICQVAYNIQGINEEDLLKLVDAELLGLRWPENIPKSRESQIFGSLNLLPRIPKDLRITMYKRLFYSATYMYLDITTIKDLVEPLMEHIKNVYTSSRRVITGHGIKVLIPSSYHSFAFGKTAAKVPVEFVMKHPLLVSLKLEAQMNPRGMVKAIEYRVTPSVYYMAYKSHHFINPVDQKAYGTYHEEKVIWSAPFEMYHHYNPENYTLVSSLKLPELPKRIFHYHSEAGTYVGDVKLDSIPSSIEREPIKTIPTQYEKEKMLGCSALPLLQVTVHSEDVSEGIEDMPRNRYEIIDLAMKYLRNPGWRRKGLNVTLVKSPRHHVDRIFYTISYNKTDEFITKPVYASNDWFLNERAPLGQLNEYDDDEEHQHHWSMASPSRSNKIEGVGLKESEARSIYETISQRLPHVAHEFEVKLTTGPTLNEATFRVEYNHTHDRTRHSVMALAMINGPERRSHSEYCFTHVMKYDFIPNEFEYNLRKYGQQKADFYSAFNLRQCKPFSSPEIVVGGSLYKVPHEELIDESELSESLNKEWLLPETHEECVRDVRDGKPLSIACTRAIREESIYNRYKFLVQWNKEIPEVLYNVTYKVDQAIKYALYKNADINRLNVHNPETTLEVTVDYINKLVETPVVNVYVRAPEENVHYRKINAKYVKPLSGLFKVEEAALNHVTNNTYPPTCAIMEKYVRTFDLKTFELPEDKCTYVVSTHCTEKKKFAVLAKNVYGSKKEVYVYVEEHEVILKKRGSSYTVLFDGRSYTITKDKPALLSEKAMIHVYVIPIGNNEQILVFHAHNAGVYIHYDGKNLKLQLTPLYKGKVCGLCSEFDGEITREYRGVDQCIYSDSEDFARSSIVDSEQCGVSTAPKKPTICPNENLAPYAPSYTTETPYDEDESRDSDRQETSQPKPKTIIMQRGDNVCFSTRPVKMCEEPQMPRSSSLKSVDFHCLPKYDAITRKLASESQKRILSELMNKSVDFSKTISVAKSCTV